MTAASTLPRWAKGAGGPMTEDGRSLLALPELTERLFFPRRRMVPWPHHVDGEDFRLACRYVRVDASRPTVVYFHGNGETVADVSATVEPWLLSLGVNLLLAEYRGYGMSSGAPSLPALLEDTVRVVRATEVEPSHLIFFGRSLGGLAAVHAAALFPRAAGLILESTLAEPGRVLQALADDAELELPPGALEAATGEYLDQRSKLATFRGRTLVLHGLLDRMVPAHHGELLHRWANEPKALVLLERGNHNTLFSANAHQYVDAVRQLVDAVAAELPPAG